MSIIYASADGYYISHELLLNEIYEDVKQCSINVNPNLFQILTPYKAGPPNRRKESSVSKVEDINKTFKDEVAQVKSYFEVFHTQLEKKGIICSYNAENKTNTVALKTSDSIYESTQTVPQDLKGGNTETTPIITTLENSRYIFPGSCYFYSKNVNEIERHIDNKFDVILLDPPWWNKYIRRKRKKSSDAYNMMYNDDLKKIPVEKMLNEDGLVVVWCTNSAQHLEDLKSSIFNKWGIQFIAKWYWVKVTCDGQPICNFADPPRKQPFEQIIFGCRRTRKLPQPPQDKIIVSVPSVLHSHKPPLTKLLEEYLPTEPKCLEIFARYLLPGWSSYGLEVLKFQHESVYNIGEKSD